LVLKYYGALHRYIQTKMDFLDISSLGSTYRYAIKIDHNFKHQKKWEFSYANPQQPKYDKYDPNKQPPENQSKPQEKKSHGKTKILYYCVCICIIVLLYLFVYGFISDTFMLYYWISMISMHISLLYLHSHFVPKIIRINQAIYFFKELIFFFISSFLSFPLNVKIIILCFVYSDDYKPTMVNSSLRREYLPSCIKLPLILHAYPPNFVDYLPMFNGEDHVAAEKHLEAFENFIDNFQIIHEDVVMRIFCKYLFGDVALWFRNLEACSIGSWTDFHDTFLRYWGENKSFDQYLIELNALKRKEDEVLTTFNIIFHSFYYNMPKDIQPSKIVAMLYYIKSQHPDLVFYLRERRSSSLEQLFVDAREIEENFWACDRLRDRVHKVMINSWKKKLLFQNTLLLI
jgi:hypothetical protein